MDGTDQTRERGPEMSGDERRQLVAMLRDELDRGWIPRRADLEALLVLVRSRAAVGHSSSPSW